MKRLLLGLTLLGAVALPAPAQEHEPAKSQESAGEKDEMMGWKWANFALLAVGLGYFMAKSLPPFFRTRGDEIRQGIDEATKLKAEAEAKAKETEDRLAAIGSDIAKLRDQLKSDLATESDRLRTETERALSRIEDQAGQEITFMTKAARQQLKAFSAELALDLAKVRIQEHMNAGVQQRLVDAFIHDLPAAERGTAVQ